MKAEDEQAGVRSAGKSWHANGMFEGMTFTSETQRSVAADGVAAAAQNRAKRAFDVCVAASALFFFGPLLLLIALAVKLDSRGPVLFRQRRTGMGGRTFEILKFRSMTVAEDGAEVVQAQRRDARVTRVGWFLRRSSFDELPQLVNVVRGEMSLIGPRPHALSHDRYFARHIENYGDRFRVRPGLTGLAQIRGLRGETRTVDAMALRVQADVEYVQAWSLGLDAVIFTKTLFVLPFHREVY